MVGEELRIWHLLARVTGSLDPGLVDFENLVLVYGGEVALGAISSGSPF